MYSGCSLCLAPMSAGSIPATSCICMCKWFPNPCSLSQVFSRISGFLLPSKLVRCIVCYVDVWTPLAISLTTLRIILAVCLNKGYYYYFCPYQEIADSILETYHQSVDESSYNLVDYPTLRERCCSACNDDNTFRLALLLLRKNKKITVATDDVPIEQQVRGMSGVYLILMKVLELSPHLRSPMTHTI